MGLYRTRFANCNLLHRNRELVRSFLCQGKAGIAANLWQKLDAQVHLSGFWKRGQALVNSLGMSNMFSKLQQRGTLFPTTVLDKGDVLIEPQQVIQTTIRGGAP